MMTTNEPMIRAIQFEPDTGSVVIEYCIPSQDARENGVLMNHTLFVPGGDDYDDELDELRHAARALLEDVLEDLPHLEPLRPAREPDDDDDEPNEDGDDNDDGG
jgi:hypothetical protein